MWTNQSESAVIKSGTDWTLTRKAGPAQRPVTLAEVKQTVRLSQSDTSHDADLLDAIDAATELVEQDTDRPTITQVFNHWLNRFPGSGHPIQITQLPVQSIDTVEYLDDAGATQTIADDGTVWKFDEGRRQVHLVNGASWPSTLYEQNSVRIEYTAGYGDTRENVPRLVKRAILLAAGQWFADPVQEWSHAPASFQQAYDRIINRILSSSYVA